jgi:hypothetical protein
VVVEGEPYARLIPHRERGEYFTMLGAAEALRTIREAQLDDEWPAAAGPNYTHAAHKAYRDFFSAQIELRVISPKRNQIIVLQPTPESGNDLVLVAPTSSDVIPRTIRDDEAFQRAKWLDVSSQDFRLLLSYKKPSASHRSRREFYERVGGS